MSYEEGVIAFLNGQGERGEFLEDMTDMEKLQAIVFERSAELLLYRAFIKEKGLKEEFKQRLEQAKTLADEQG